MKRFILPFAACGLFSLGLNAGIATVVGEATTSAKGEYIEFSISVSSKCFPSREEVKKNHNEIVMRLDKAMKGLIESPDEMNFVRTGGSYSGPYSETIYNDLGKPETICKNTYQKSSTITFRTSDVDHFSDMFDAINNEVDMVMAGKEGTARTPSSTATVNRPYSEICEKTRMAMRLKALNDARDNALQQFKAIYEPAGVRMNSVKLVRSNAPVKTSSYSGYEKAPAAMPSSSGGSIEISFDDIQVSVSHEFQFEYEDCMPFTKCNV